MEQIQSAVLIETARELARLKVRYLHQGRNLNGLDCIGMIVYVLGKHKVLPFDFERRNYGRLPLGELLEKTSIYCAKINEPIDGCMVLITWPGERRPAHVALYSDGNLIHSYARAKKIVEHGFRNPWPRWASGFYKLPGVIYE